MNVQGPDGSVVNFPDGTDAATIDQVMRQNFSAPAEQPGILSRVAHGADDAVRNVVNGMTLGYADKLAAGLDSLTGRVPDYETGLAAQRAQSDKAMANQGMIAGNAEQIGGMLLPGGVAAKGVNLAAKVVGGASPMLRALATGATVGGVDAAGHDQDVTTGAVLGAGAGGVGQLAAKGLGAAGNAIASRFNPAVVQPATKDFAAAAGDKYLESEASDTLVNAAALQRLKNTIQQTMYDAGFDPNLHPGGNTIVNRLNEFPKPVPVPALTPGAAPPPAPIASAPGLPPFAPTGASGPTALSAVPGAGAYPPAAPPIGPTPAGVTLKGIDGLRQIAGGMAGGTPAGGRLGRLIQGNIDDFLDTLHPTNDLIGGNSQQGVDALNEARGLWQTMSKSRALDEANAAAVDRAGATGSGGNITNVTKQNAIRLQNSRKDWTPDEQAALTDLIRGTPTSNALRLLGKLSPGGNGLSLWKTLELTAAGAGAGHLADGLPGAVVGGLGAAAVPTVGMFAKNASDRATARAAGALGQIIRNGGQAIPPVVNAGQALARGAVQPLSRAFMLGGVNASLGNSAPDSRPAALNSVLNGTHPGLGAAFQ